MVDSLPEGQTAELAIAKELHSVTHRGTAVQFGAGNIGRGFLAQLFHESGLAVVFVDVADTVVADLNARRAYEIEIVGPGAHTVGIDGVRAVCGRDTTQVAQEIASAQIVATAVGAGALVQIAPALAAGLQMRMRSGRPPLNILLCENLIDAPDRLRNAVLQLVPVAEHTALVACTGFVQAVVSRMVPVQTAGCSLTMRVEAYNMLPIDAASLVAPIDDVPGVVPVDNFAAHVARKLYTHNCAHAALGYLGYRFGHVYGYEALRDPTIRAQVDAVLNETGRALIARFGFDPAEHWAHTGDLLARFANEELGDTCRRLARDPIRKLAPGDRLVGAARLCESQSIEPCALAHVIAASLHHDDPDDPTAPELRRMLRTDGLPVTLQTVCQIAPGEPLYELIERAEAQG